MSDSEARGRCRREVDSYVRLDSHHEAIADALDRLAADVAEVKEAVCDGSVAAERDRFLAGMASAIRERGEARKERDEAIRERDLAIEHVKQAICHRDEALAEAQRIQDEADDQEQTEKVKRLNAEIEKIHRTLLNRTWERDETRAEVERLKAKLEQQPPAAPQPAAPPPGWLTTEERGVIVCAASELSAIGHHRPLDKEQCLRLSAALRSVVKRHDEGAPPVVEVPKMSDLSVAARVEAQCYRDALDKAGVAWKEVGRE